MAFLLIAPLAQAETITYTIKQMGVNAGQATLTWGGETELEGQKLALVIFKADGFNFYDEEKIYLTPDTLKPVVIIRDLNIFGKKEKITEHYLPKESRIVVSKEAGGKKTEQTLQKDGTVDNIYGFIYRYRREGNFKIGNMLELKLPTKDLKIKLVKQVKVSAAGQDFDSFYMETKPGQYKLWFDAGPKKLPLRISGAMGIANTVMIMKEVKE